MAKYYPKINFVIDPKIDIRPIFNWDGMLLGTFIGKNMHFVLRPEFAKMKNKILEAYADNYYEVNKDLIIAGLKDTKNKWQKHEKSYFKKVDKIFHNYPWPKGKCTGIISIWFCYPRNIGNRTFSFPLIGPYTKHKDNDLRVIGHEMLHFITYDYLQKKYNHQPSEVRDRDNFFWQFTENLNVLIENSAMWKEFSGPFKSKPKDNCADLYMKMKRIGDKNNDLDNLIIKTFKLKKSYEIKN